MKVGDVFFTHIPTLHKPKDKFLAVVCSEDPVRFVLINTKNRADVLQNPDLAATQVQISPSQLPVLSHDSWIGCEELFAGYTATQLAQLEESGHKSGELPLDILAAVLVAIDLSPTIAERQKNRCRQALQLALSPP